MGKENAVLLSDRVSELPGYIAARAHAIWRQAPSIGEEPLVSNCLRE